MKLGIDASNIRRGGGVSHLVELLNAAEPRKYGFDDVLVWAGSKTARELPTRDWLRIVTYPSLDKGLISRTIWHATQLKSEAKSQCIDCLFVPGGMDLSGFRPMVTMNQNLLPFDSVELQRFGISLRTARLWLLRLLQTRTMRRSDAVIFLTKHAVSAVTKVVGQLNGSVRIVPHGINARFFIPPRRQREVEEFTADQPCRVLYVSIIDEYKHQWNVVDAVAQLRSEGFYVQLDLVGPAAARPWRRLEKVIKSVDPEGRFVHYRGSVDYSQIHNFYRNADVHVFASSCETFGQILTEAMAAGLPNLSSSRAAMPEILGPAGEYFDPENSSDIKNALRRVITSRELRDAMARGAFERAQEFPWSACADATFSLLADVARSR